MDSSDLTKMEMSLEYIHGYSADEQQRLIEQARYWQTKLILSDLNYSSGTNLLEIGCGAGAVLGILGKAFPGLNWFRRLLEIDNTAVTVVIYRAFGLK